MAPTQETLDELGVTGNLNKFLDGSISKPIAVPGTYQKVEQQPQGVFKILLAAIKGVYDTIDIILFVFILGGCIGVLNYMGAFNAAIAALSKVTKGKEYILIILITIIIAAGGTTFGLAEETIALYPILVPVFLAAGYDVMVCIAAIYMGSSIGTMFIAFPIFYPAGIMLGANEMMMAGCIVSGAIFGDNLAPISDTTIASASTQQFKNGKPADIGGVVSSRIKYSAVAGLITIVIFAVFGGMGGVYEGGSIDAAANPVSLVMLIPVVLMLTVSTKTRNIYEGILVGLVTGTVVGLAAGLFTPAQVFSNDAANNAAVGFLIDGINNILPTCALVISVFGIMGVLSDAGMLNLIAEKILNSRMASTTHGAELICMMGIAFTTILLGGVTSASILTFGPILNKIGAARNIHPYRRANLLDGTANSLPAIIPFMSVFVFIGSALTGLSPVVVAGGTIYGFVLFAVFLGAVLTGWGCQKEE